MTNGDCGFTTDRAPRLLDLGLQLCDLLVDVRPVDIGLTRLLKTDKVNGLFKDPRLRKNSFRSDGEALHEPKEPSGGGTGEHLNGLLDAEADRLCGAKRYERSADRVDTRSGHYPRTLTTTAGDVETPTADRPIERRTPCLAPASRKRAT